MGADSCVGAGSAGGVDSSAGAALSDGGGDSGVGSGEGVGSPDGFDSWEGVELSDVCGACSGGWTCSVELEDSPPLWLELGDRVALERDARDALIVLPGKAWAATSVKAPVSTTDPAIIQRLIRPSLRRAASLVFVGLKGIVSGCRAPSLTTGPEDLEV